MRGSLFSARILLGVLLALGAIDVAAWWYARARNAATTSGDRDIVLSIGSFEFTRFNPRDQQTYRVKLDVSVHLSEDLEVKQGA